MGKAIPFAEIMVIDGEGRDAEEGELVHADPWSRRAIGRTRAYAERFKPAPVSSAYAGMAVWSGDRVRRDATACSISSAARTG